MEFPPLSEMTTEEKLDEICTNMRQCILAFESFSQSPMAKMIPGLSSALPTNSKR